MPAIIVMQSALKNLGHRVVRRAVEKTVELVLDAALGHVKSVVEKKVASIKAAKDKS